MTDVIRPSTSAPADAPDRSRSGLSPESIRRGIADHLRYSIGRPAAVLTPEHFYRATALAVRDRMQDNWSATHAHRWTSAAR
jgi:glycogen phosphorylase